ncbi:MAG: hypothetical protein WCK95_07260 [Alphaproteobacteria bacterium]|jgi:hypothetical protein
MSISEVERFAASLKSNADLRVETGKAQVAESSTTPLARAVAFAGSKGYRFTADEVKDYARAKAKPGAKELPDAEFDIVLVTTGKKAPKERGIFLNIGLRIGELFVDLLDILLPTRR